MLVQHSSRNLNDRRTEEYREDGKHKSRWNRRRDDDKVTRHLDRRGGG
jgi:hypothetical protein